MGSTESKNKETISKETVSKETVSKAIACFNNTDYVLFTKLDNKRVQIDIKLSNLNFIKNTKHGFHIHNYGDLRNSCNNVCKHFNPYNKTHGGGINPSHIRHVGDLGNITADENGQVNETKIDYYISLDIDNPAYIIGRSLVIHEGEDDCGLGEGDKKKESLITGNSGKKIACAAIGIAEP